MKVLCVKVGNRFGPDYVNRLQAMVARHLSYEHTFICLTDNPEGLNCQAETIDPEVYPTWWGKILAFTHDERVLLFDLDTVIVDSIDFMAAYDGDFCTLRGFGYPFRYGSAVLSIAPGFGRHVHEEYAKDPAKAQWISGSFGDGQFMQLCLGEQDRWQDLYPGKFVSYKAHCQQGVPEGAAVVCFHGTPRPHEINTPWLDEHWHVLPADARAA